MLTLQPAEWSKPRGFSHGVAVDGPGRWIVLAGQTGGDEKGEYPPEMAAQVGVALKRIIKLLAEAGAGPEHIVRLTWYLTSRSEYEAAGAGIGAAWRETLGRNSRPRRCSISTAWSMSGPRSRSKSPPSCRRPESEFQDIMMKKRSTSADFVTAFATGWPENEPHIMVLSLTTSKGIQDFALNKEQALLVAKTMNETAARLAQPKAD